MFSRVGVGIQRRGIARRNTWTEPRGRKVRDCLVVIRMIPSVLGSK